MDWLDRLWGLNNNDPFHNFLLHPSIAKATTFLGSDVYSFTALCNSLCTKRVLSCFHHRPSIVSMPYPSVVPYYNFHNTSAILENCYQYERQEKQNKKTNKQQLRCYILQLLQTF